MVDYPNSKKARKVFLCLFIGDGGSAQVPKGLEGNDAAVAAAAMEEGEDAKEKAKFERRRQRESRRERNGKQKTIKGGKDWILRKKDVRGAPSNPQHFSPLLLIIPNLSCTEDEERRACLTIPSTQVAKEGQYSKNAVYYPYPQVVLYSTRLAHNESYTSSIVAQPRALSSMLQHLLRCV